jgi:AraC-like DNA-binding protein
MPSERLFLGEELETCIERYQPEEAHRVIDIQLSQMRRVGPYRLEVCRYICVIPLARCCNGAIRAGVDRDRVMPRYWKRIEQLPRLRTWARIVKHLHEFADDMLEQVRPERRTNIQRLVANIRQEIRQRLDNPSTLAEFADAAGVSRAYLSRCFTKIVGRSFRAELRAARLQAASQLLRETSLKVGVIAHHVGLRDPSQFIADFRRFTGQTPAEFRRSQLAGEFPGAHGDERSL